MKIVFVSNYINHHQIPFCEAMKEALGEGYTFIQTQPMEEERVKLGWQQEVTLPYVKYAYEEIELCRELVQNCDVVIWGGVEDEIMLKPRLEAGKPVLRYSERLYKTGQWKAISPRGLWKKYHDHTKYRKAPVYLLCAGAYVASDFQIIRAYPEKMFKWGYFPVCKSYDVDSLMAGKIHAKNAKHLIRKTEILWAARFIDWKHPELVVALAEKLSEQGRKDFHITMIGGGVLTEKIEASIKEKSLEEYITIAGTKTPDEVRAAMESTPIFLMTSDRQEGWGAVMNEAMNSGCVVIADRMEGATPYLIEHGKNGFCYKTPTADKLAELIMPLLDSGEYCEQLGLSAYRTITELWNAKKATERLLCLCKEIVSGKEPRIPWEQGPCSRAEVIKERG
ncbi:MAG: glycosyltransferase family 4 protein [Lachnospiraceae bacterium]|nr:glycosyltransferase family 4 protein [Lachnospiraceae bacterium]